MPIFQNRTLIHYVQRLANVTLMCIVHVYIVFHFSSVVKQVFLNLTQEFFGKDNTLCYIQDRSIEVMYRK